jgi:hypothetical protein
MTRRSYSGNAPSTTLASGIDASTLTIPVASGTGYPDGSGGPFYIVIDPGLASEEKVLCDETDGNTITANAAGRGADDTTAASHTTSAVVQHIYTATDADEANAHVNNTGDDNHTQYYNAARFAVAHDVEARHTFGNAYGTPSTPVVSTATADAGAGNNPAREDHVHPIGIWAVWTPVLRQGSTTFTTDTQNGGSRYVRIGNFVHAVFQLEVTSGTLGQLGQEIHISLPVPATVANMLGTWAGMGDISDMGRGHIYLAGSPLEGRFDFMIFNSGDASDTIVEGGGQVGNGDNITGWLTYEATT